MPSSPYQKTISKAQARIQQKYRLPVTILVSAATLLAIAYLVLAGGSTLLRFGIGILVLIISGQMIASANSIKSFYGAYMLGGRHGINFVESLSRKHPNLWKLFADWGLAFSFGLLAYFVFKKQISKKIMALGLITILVVLVFVYPYLPIILTFINIPQITSRIPAPSIAPQNSFYPGSFTPYFYIFLALSLIGGFSLSTMMLVLLSGGVIVLGVAKFLLSLSSPTPNYTNLTNLVPGVAPIIPGITIPFFAGVISLVLLLVVHEFSHGVLARIVNVKIRSIGIILFGVIPMGAFVEPDENSVKKLKLSAQDRISVAGVSANMLFCLIFFVITFIMLTYVLPGFVAPGVLVTAIIPNTSAYHILPVNSIMLKWNNYTINNISSLASIEQSYKPGTRVNLSTNVGTFGLIPSNTGKLGIIAAPVEPNTTSYQVSNFVFAVVALSFGLNFFVAIFNLLPIPGFDGWRIYQNRIKNKTLLKALSALIILAILVNVLPWFWTIS